MFVNNETFQKPIADYLFSMIIVNLFSPPVPKEPISLL